MLIFLICAFAIRGQLTGVWSGQKSPEISGVELQGDTLSPIADEERIISIVDKGNAAVVSIVATKDVPVLERYFEEYRPFGPNGGAFRVPRLRQEGTEEREVGGGSGFIVSKEGLLITNRHVVSDEDAAYTVMLSNGKDYPAKVIARDRLIDIAVLKIDGGGQEFPYLAFADSDTLKLGQTAIAIGNALGEFRNSVSVGVVSGLSRSIIAGDYASGGTEELSDVVQTDAAINPGNSGGPLLDSQGRVIGVNVAVALGSENIGFALPSNAVRTVVDSVVKTGEIIRPYLGVRYEMTNHDGATEPTNRYGALIVEVVKGSPGAKAGIQKDDIIQAIDGQTLDTRTLSAILQRKNVGDTVTVTVLRGGKEMTLHATLERMPENL